MDLVYTGRFAVNLNCRRQSAMEDPLPSAIGNRPAMIYPLNYTIFKMIL